jgi:hypothetical protein
MATSLTLFIGENEPFDSTRVREIVSRLPGVHGLRNVGTAACDFEWRVESSVDSAIATIVKGGATIDIWALNDAALTFVASFARVYGKRIQLIDSAHGTPVSIVGTESPSEILRRIAALD